MSLLKMAGGFFLDIIETGVIALSIFLVVWLFLVQPHQVNGESMVPTFQSGEYVLTDKISYSFSDPQRGDVVVFSAPEQANCAQGTGCDFIKRVIALPGETIQLENSRFIINGQFLQELYIPGDYVTRPGLFLEQVGRYTLGDNEYFVVGDNRPYSSDSRAWGPVTKQDIIGRAMFRYWPLNVAGVVKHEDYRLTGF